MAYVQLIIRASDLSWDTRLVTTIFKLELIADANIYLFFQNVMRGGVSYVSNKYSNGNKKCLKSYEQKRKSKHMVYFDPNNLYYYLMSKFHQTVGFNCIDNKRFDLNKYSNNSSKGCLLELILNILKNYLNCTMIVL